MYSSLFKSRRLQFVLTLETPDGQIRLSQNDVAAGIQRLINNQNSQSSNGESLIPGFSDFEGYKCLDVKRYESVNTPKPVPQILKKIPLPNLSSGTSDCSELHAKIWRNVRKGGLVISSAFLTIIIEHLGVPVLHWIFTTLANYVR